MCVYDVVGFGGRVGPNVPTRVGGEERGEIGTRRLGGGGGGGEGRNWYDS